MSETAKEISAKAAIVAMQEECHERLFGRRRQAYEWAKNQNFSSVAATYARELADLADDLARQLLRAWSDLTSSVQIQVRDMEINRLCNELVEAKRREWAAVALIPHKCYLCVGCDNREAIEPIHGGCPIWQWCGPLEAGEGAE